MKVKKASQSGIVPYTTKTGIQIGSLYQRPLARLTADEELIQAALLGHRPRLGIIEIAEWVVYGALLVGAISLLLAWGASK
jgi:hypothetical protein